MKIKHYRKQMNITQSQLANLLKVKRSTVAMWEIGKSNPRANRIEEIAKILQCSVDDLFN